MANFILKANGVDIFPLTNICTIISTTNTDIFIFADIWPIIGILANICRYFGQYPSILANTDITDIQDSPRLTLNKEIYKKKMMKREVNIWSNR